MQRIDDRLSPGDDLIDVVVEVENPVQSSACCGGVMSSPQEQNTTIGDLMLRKSTRSPRDVRICPLESLLPTNRLSAIHCISPAFKRTGLPHQVSKSRNRSGSVSIFEYTL
jgi:hypothetical protein